MGKGGRGVGARQSAYRGCWRRKNTTAKGAERGLRKMTLPLHSLPPCKEELIPLPSVMTTGMTASMRSEFLLWTEWDCAQEPKC